VREGGGERGIEPNKTSRGKRIAWGAQGQDMTINDKHDRLLTFTTIAHTNTLNSPYYSPYKHIE
jgi:hypothetical protein